MISNYLQHHPKIGEEVYIAEQATVIGRVVLEQDVSIWPQAVVRGDVNDIHIGAGTNVQDGSVLHNTHDSPYQPGGHPLIIGRSVTIGHLAMLHGCNIGNTCLIGMRAVVLDGVKIPDFTMIGANALVSPNKELTSHTLWLGAPAKPVRDLTEQEIEYLTYSAEHYKRLKSNYLSMG